MTKNIDNIYKAELNFVDEFNLKRHGMIMEIEQEFNTIKLCFQQTGLLDKQYQPMIDRIIVMPLRKLLCEESSVLLEVCPDFKMPPLLGMINWEGKDKDLLALIKYTVEEDKLAKVLENPQVLKTPVVRNGKQSTLGYQPDVWKGWT